MPTYEHEGTIVRFPDNAVGLSISGLLSNKGMFHVKVSPGTTGEVFAFLSPTYILQLTIDSNAVEFRRNQFEARKTIGNVRRHFQILVSWKPDQIQLALMIDDDAGEDDACVTVPTAPLYVPLPLLAWARRFNLLPRTTYVSPAEFLGVFLESLRQARRNILDSNSVALFWDRQPSGTEEAWVPKREPDAMAGIAGFLQDQSLLGGYQLIQESSAAGGSLDLRAIAPLQSGGACTVCVEGKNAHSADVNHGISDQLPAYMQSARADYGVYLLLWYRCDMFDRPAVSDVDLTWSLSKLRPWETIAVEMFDLGFAKSPSRREYRYE